MWSLTLVTTTNSSFTFIDNPLTRKMSEMAPYLTVTSGFRGPEMQESDYIHSRQ